MSKPTWEDLLRAGDLTGAMSLVKETVRSRPADGDSRLLLAMLAALSGDWKSAARQVAVYGETSSDEQRGLLTMTLNSLIQSEVERTLIFSGDRKPVIFGEPLPWMGDLFLLHQHLRNGDYTAASIHRERVAEIAKPSAGEVDAVRFAWLGDSDCRFCSVIEAFIGCNYYWVPLQHIRSMALAEPLGVRDLVWQPVHFRFNNGGEAPGYLPVRYPGSEKSENMNLVLARETIWEEPYPGIVLAKGQRVLTDGETDFPMLDIRRIEFDSEEV